MSDSFKEKRRDNQILGAIIGPVVIAHIAWVTFEMLHDRSVVPDFQIYWVLVLWPLASLSGRLQFLRRSFAIFSFFLAWSVVTVTSIPLQLSHLTGMLIFIAFGGLLCTREVDVVLDVIFEVVRD